MATRSFGRPVSLRHDLEAAVATFVARAAEKMRRQGLATASLIVFCHTNRYRPDQRQYGATRHVQLTVATADTGRLTRAAMFGLDCIEQQLLDVGYMVSHAWEGVGILSLVPSPIW